MEKGDAFEWKLNQVLCLIAGTYREAKKEKRQHSEMMGGRKEVNGLRAKAKEWCTLTGGKKGKKERKKGCDNR